MTRGALPALQGLRVLATLGIFLFHSGFLWNGTFPVTFFFMLSGFVMYYTKSELQGYQNYSQWIKGYFWKKFKQFYPVHIVVFILSVIIRGGIQGKEIHAVLQLLLVQSFFPKYTFAFNGLSWYLSITLFLYLIAWFLIRAVNYVKKPLFGATTVLAVIAVLNIVSADEYSNPFYRILDFALGMFICKQYMQEKCPRGGTLLEIGCVVILCIQYVFSFVMDVPYGTGYYSLLFAITLYAFAVGSGKLSSILSNRLFAVTSKYTFAFYMIHEQILIIFRRVFPDETIFYPVRCAMVAVPAFVIACVLSVLWINLSNKTKEKNEQ